MFDLEPLIEEEERVMLSGPMTQREKELAEQRFMLSTSLGRFHHRVKLFRESGRSVLVHHWWWFVHNCVSHTMIGLLPVRWTFAFHDWTSLKINGK